MAHLLTDCIDLLQKAWGEVKYTESNKIKLESNLSELFKDIKLKDKDGTVDSYWALNRILAQKIKGNNRVSKGFTCRNLYESLVILLNSNYEKYNIINIGKAINYLNEALPLYKELCGGSVYINLRTKKGENIKEQLESGSILSRLEKDINDIHILISPANYTRVLSCESGYDVIPVAVKGYYEIQIVSNKFNTRGIGINKRFSLRVINNKTGKELKADNYSDIKKILNRA